MIENATIISIQQPPKPDGRGGQTTEATATVSIGCNLSQLRTAKRPTVNGREVDATAVAYVLMGLFEGFSKRQQLSFDQGSTPIAVMEIVEIDSYVHSMGQSHWKLFLKAR